MSSVTCLDQLEAIYDLPGTASLVKEVPHITTAYRTLLESAPFCALATCGPEGLDCSPRGDVGACVQVLNDKTILMPDRRGNNRIDSLRNIVRDPRVALMFLIPGSNTALRINGRAEISIADGLLARFERDGARPRTVLAITVDAIYFQCARALKRAGMWDTPDGTRLAALPSPGTILQEIAADFDGRTYDREWPDRAAKTMW